MTERPAVLVTTPGPLLPRARPRIPPPRSGRRWTAGCTLFGAHVTVALAQAPASPPVLQTAWGAAPDCPALVQHANRELAQGGAQAFVDAAALVDAGRCVTADAARASALLGQAARQGHAGAARWVSLRFARGQGVPQSYANAGAWLSGKGASDESLEPWDYSIGYAHALASAALDALALPPGILSPDTDVPMVLQVQAQGPRAIAVRFTGADAADREPARAQVQAAFDAALARTGGGLPDPDPRLLVPAQVTLPITVRMTADRQLLIRQQEPVLR